MTTGLADRLRADTRAVHTELERGPFMQAMLRGNLTRTGYCNFLRNLYPIYVELETALLRRASDPLLAPLVMPVLFRSQSLARRRSQASAMRCSSTRHRAQTPRLRNPRCSTRGPARHTLL